MTEESFAINLNGYSALFATFQSRHIDFDAACDYCLDAPLIIPSGSTREFRGPGQGSIATYEWRDK